MREEFLNDLKKKAVENNLDVDSIIKKYSSKIDLDLESGMSEDEIIKRFGSTDEIIKGLMPRGDSKHVYTKKYTTVNISTSALTRFKMYTVSGNEINVLFSDDDIKDLYYIDDLEDIFTLKLKKSFKSTFLRNRGEVIVEIGEDILIENLNINLVNEENDLSNLNFYSENIDINTVNGKNNFGIISTKNMNFHTVAGEINFISLKSNEVELSNVSAILNFELIEADSVKIENVSGEVNMTGNIMNKVIDNVSGRVMLNGEKISKSIGESIKEIFKRKK